MVKQAYPTEWDAKAPRLAVMAAWINEHTSMLAELSEGFCSTDRKLAGTRLIHKGKGRTGTRLKVYSCLAHKVELFRKPYSPYRDVEREYPPQPLLDHNAAETYRQNADVVRWLAHTLGENPGLLTKPPGRK